MLLDTRICLYFILYLLKTFKNLTIFYVIVLSCATCPSKYTGQVCKSRYQLPSTCKTGEVVIQNGTDCILCLAGYQCPYPGQDMIKCPQGMWSLAGSTSCAVCPAGFFCPNDNSFPIPCPSGSYRSLNNISDFLCSPCPGGFSCEDPSAAPVPCYPGNFAK